MNMEPEWRLELSPVDLDAQYGPEGSIAAAVAWVERVLDGRLGEAWLSTGALFRLALTRYWCWNHRFALHRAGHDPVQIASVLADDDGPAHPLWPAFARGQQTPGPAPGGSRWVAAGPAEPIGPDLEVVELVCPTVARIGHRCPPVALLLRLGPRGWQVAGHGRVPAKAGWPPGQK